MVDVQDFIDVIAEICEEENLVVTCKESLKGALVTCVTTFVGGMLLGPAGLAVGGIAGSAMSAVSARGKFKPVGVIVKEMNPAHRQKIYDRVRYAFRNVDFKDVVTVITLIKTENSFKELAVNEVKKYLTNEMGLTVHQK